ncbi:hypothetical protein ACFWSF_32405 [Streptomyces sp. NPDC058611]|uniref:hypothetical protein n=1 Tax=unclassified Streptomyces TaxID=2593676 RepID=UPI00366374FC
MGNSRADTACFNRGYAVRSIGSTNHGRAGELPEFERIVLFGVAGLPGRQYPPPGHDYPRT